MRNRRRHRMLMGLGALLGLWSVGCQTAPWTSVQNGGLYQALARRQVSSSPAAELLQPRAPSEDVVANAAPAPASAASLTPPNLRPAAVVRTNHDEEVGNPVVASSWRSLGRESETIAPGVLDLGPTLRTLAPQTSEQLEQRGRPQALASVRQAPSRSQVMEKLPTPRPATPAGKGHRVVEQGQGQPPAKFLSKATPAMPAVAQNGHHRGDSHAPHEGQQVQTEDYVIDPPDVLIIRMPQRERQLQTQADARDTLPDVVGGEHLVRPDGSISLGVYGAVRVAGRTIEQARLVVAQKLVERNLKPLAEQGGKIPDPENPEKTEEAEKLSVENRKDWRIRNMANEIALDVVGYRSKFYYVIADGAGNGEQVVPILVTGNDTVLDAISKVGGLPTQASKKKIWVARPCRPGSPQFQLLPVDWRAITREGQQATNYKLFQGDRIYVNSDPRLKAFTHIDRSFDPIDRTLGSVLLGSAVVRSVTGQGNRGNTNTNR